MKRSLAIACGLLVLGGAISAWSAPAFAQAPASPFGPPPTSAFGPPPASAFGPPAASAFGPPAAPGAAQCQNFVPLSAEAKKRADAVQAAINAKVDRKQVCVLMTNFVAAEGNVIKFLEENKSWCGVPDDAIKMSKMNHEKSLKFRTVACSADNAPTPKVPTLSDAIKMPSVDSATNTKTGRGTFDTLTGNPLSR